MGETNGKAAIAWITMEVPKEPSIMRDKVRSFCRSNNNSSTLNVIAPELVAFSVECPGQINSSTTTITWTYVPSPSLSRPIGIQYATCVQDTCTPLLYVTDASASVIVQNATIPGPGNYSVHLQLVWTTPSSMTVECVASTSIEMVASSPTDSFSTSGTTHVLVVVGIVAAAAVVFIAVGRVIYVRRRRSRSKEGIALDTPVDVAPTASLVPPSAGRPSSWFEAVYNNDHSLPTSILHDDRFTRAILRSSVPSDKDMSFHSHSELFDTTSLHDDTPAISVATSSSCTSLSNLMQTPWHDFNQGRSPGNSSYNSSLNSSRFDHYLTSDLEE
ncbi:hypothetical protein H310_11846 [Aphanomyces invadans]|uniref:Ig-like domain-containing protein n=1 Tax=Aphanomyces invadans TaxID=157072 RepID=A0A024TKK1_9STRA|nr:hypothetical protein H310_11846 [Aphanomyces invadans]ETV94568.1 hypothetical protein H310_11846 [Aphanomyces invadans]|eukprot:XP_008876883.1 hypothetical protein H310_11846 [Aphanomyces invadans]